MRVRTLVEVRTCHLRSARSDRRAIAGRCSLALLLALVAAAPSFGTPAEAMLPIECQVRDRFPSVALDSQATLEGAEELVAGRMVSGMRARQPQAALRVFYPGSYDEAFVAELGGQRVALRAVGARFAQAVAAGGKVFYARPHESVDVIEVPGMGRSEELLVLHDARAPRVFEYEIVEMRGVAGLSLHDGAIRFLPDRVAMPAVAAIGGGRFTTPQPSLQIDRPWVIDANGKRSESAAWWTVGEEEGRPRTIRLTISSEPLAYPLVVDPSFSATGSLGGVRYGHTATLLPNGKVLIAGGNNGSANLNTAELYDPATGAFTSAGTMTDLRSGHTATLLPNGKVLIAGGISGATLITAELYDPAAGTFTATAGTMTAARANHTATLLANGKVLIAGGAAGATTRNTTELYDSGTFTASGNLAAARYSHTATLLPNGKVLIAGGSDSNAPLNTADLYDPANGTSTATGNLAAARFRHTATLLPNGNVLIAAGASTLFGASLSSAELYNPAGNGFTATGTMTAGRQDQTATLLPNGKVLIAGGAANGLSSAPLNTAELYDPTPGTFTATVTMAAARWNHTATLLPNGSVLIAGGKNPAALNTAELYDPATGTFAATGSMSAARRDHTATLLPNGKVLIAGGQTTGGVYLNTAELYDPAAGTFTATTGSMTAARTNHTATLLPNGKVLIAGGNSGAAYLNTAELYDPAVGTFTATGTMTAARVYHTATLLPNGKVLLAGGQTTGGVYLNTAVLYDPATGTFAATGSMSAARSIHTATLLPNGKVLLAGGNSGAAYLNTAELYDPATGTFAATGSMTAARAYHTATLLPNGKVLIAGGVTTGFAHLNTAELYDPATGTFAATGSMSAARYLHTATLPPNGKVLIAGGFGALGAHLNTAELYDPATGTFAATGSMAAARGFHTTTLLPNGKVLIAGGFGVGDAALNSAELYDIGLGYSDARRPVVSTLTNLLCQPANLSLSGLLFTGDSEGSSGSTSSSPANAPLLRLLRVDNEQLTFASPQSFSASAYFSATLSNLASGRYRAAIVSNAIPSAEQIIEVWTTPLLGAYGTASVNLSGSTGVAPSSLPAGYNGAFYPLTASASAGFTGTLTVNGTTGVVNVTNAGPIGTFTITVSSSTSCGSPSTTFTLNVLGPPASVTATGGTPQSAPVNTPFASQLQATVKDSAAHPLSNVTVTFTAPASGASATFSGGGTAVTDASGVASITATANGIPGSFNATAQVGALTATFALTNTPGIPSNVLATAVTPTSVSVTWTAGAAATMYEIARSTVGMVYTTLGTSASSPFTDSTATANTAYLYKVRASAPGFSSYSAPDLATTVIFTDSIVTAGATIVKAAHFNELGTAINAVRSLAGLTPFSFTDATLTPGSTTVKAVHLTERRAALDAARSSLLLPAISYANPGTAGTTIRAADIIELRNGVK